MGVEQIHIGDRDKLTIADTQVFMLIDRHPVNSNRILIQRIIRLDLDRPVIAPSSPTVTRYRVRPVFGYRYIFFKMLILYAGRLRPSTESSPWIDTVGVRPGILPRRSRPKCGRQRQTQSSVPALVQVLRSRESFGQSKSNSFASQTAITNEPQRLLFRRRAGCYLFKTRSSAWKAKRQCCSVLRTVSVSLACQRLKINKP
jgi:hypothetical protein